LSPAFKTLHLLQHKAQYMYFIRACLIGTNLNLVSESGFEIRRRSIKQKKLNRDYFKDGDLHSKGYATSDLVKDDDLMLGTTEHFYNRVSNFLLEMKRGEMEHIRSIKVSARNRTCLKGYHMRLNARVF